jgi:hypothetical protein
MDFAKCFFLEWGFDPVRIDPKLDQTYKRINANELRSKLQFRSHYLCFKNVFYFNNFGKIFQSMFRKKTEENCFVDFSHSLSMQTIFEFPGSRYNKITHAKRGTLKTLIPEIPKVQSDILPCEM